MTKQAYPEITNEEFDKRLIEKLEDMTAENLLKEIPSVYDFVAEYFNNDILDDYEYDNEHYMNFDAVMEMFLQGHECSSENELKEKFNFDLIAIREEFNNYTDMLCKDGEISDWAYENWDNPF